MFILKCTKYSLKVITCSKFMYLSILKLDSLRRVTAEVESFPFSLWGASMVEFAIKVGNMEKYRWLKEGNTEIYVTLTKKSFLLK